jgi:regulator of sigma E protease
VGVSDVASQAFSFGVPEALWVLALLSLSLAVINLFPFLPLDGGHLFWALAEKVRGRAIPFAVMERASVVGIALVLVVAAIGLSNDIDSLSNGSLTLHR